ncbi:LuxR C-terminal-related transcriptional regulator [Spongiivirga citrea]|uniref:PAS domain-containing protein n=1 Tax=Spongiivirga citrea TaxID=1481457 RepID=A0A6M0CFF6_9FLAO|nr:LuxR C-terminal-related transcriptional regulator [Spongiivirga citrea]NER16588.1 PAS domain-containing protein [Spongiivirga citrea]
MNEAIISYSEIFDTNGQYDGTYVREYVDKLQYLDDHTPPLQSYILVTNTSTQTYEYVGSDFEKTIGLDREKMLSDGLGYYISNYHPQELPVLLKIFEELMVFTMTQLELEQRQRVVYTWNYRIKNGSGDYKSMHVQQTPIFFDTNGRPIIGYSQNTIVGDGRPRPLVATCKYLNKNNEFETLFSKNYLLEALQQMLTKRELEIVKLLANSYTTKDIATELFISEQTVSVHRKNILNKLSFVSTAEIIEYCNKYQVF